MPISVRVPDRFQHDRTTRGVRPMKPSMVWMRRPSRFGTPQRTHLRGLGLAISKKRPYLTGQVLRRKSERGDRHALAQGAGESQQQGLLWCGLGTDRVSGRVDCPAGFAFSRLNLRDGTAGGFLLGIIVAVWILATLPA